MAAPLRAMSDADGLHIAVAGQSLDGLLLAVRRLDQRLARACAAVQDGPADSASAGPYRGLYISDEEVSRLLAASPCEPPFAAAGHEGEEHFFDSVKKYPGRLSELAQAYGLSCFDLDVLVIALAPELDLRYERLYAFVQDDVMRRRPSVELALNLLCSSATAKLSRLEHFSPDAPLVVEGLLHLLPDPNHIHPPFLAHYLKLDEQVVRLLLGLPGLDPRLAPFCEWVGATAALEDLPLGDGQKRALLTLASGAREAGRPLRLHFHGGRGVGKRRAAEALAAEVGAPLLACDLAKAPDSADFGQTMRLVFREARMQDALLYLEGIDSLHAADRAAHAKLFAGALSASACVVILAGERETLAGASHGSLKVADVPFPTQDFTQRRSCWQEALRRQGVTLDEADLDALAGRFRMPHGEIDAAAAGAADRALWREAAQPEAETPQTSHAQPTISDLYASARAQASHNLGELARKVEARYGWDDIVLPPDQLSQLKEICQQVKHRHVVYGEWGFDRKLSLGKGLNALFAGPPGTGKTMAAEVVARELHLDLYKIDLSQVVSKYIGETEKNLDRVFREARSSYSILFFDEADALFGKRSEVKDAHDRYANIEVGYLLQKMEEYDGIAVLATNLRQHMDEAFVRRMHVIIEFPFPDEEYRRRIWEVAFPTEAPLSDDVDFRLLAREVKLAGGNIKNIALASAFYAAGEGGGVRLAHLLRAAGREYQKLGRAWAPVSNGGGVPAA
ncbi:MAG: ATP-binding protein [Acidobacteria bacterium]|nr:ATP-binding protein [Acidobacteriota bacterium]